MMSSRKEDLKKIIPGNPWKFEDVFGDLIKRWFYTSNAIYFYNQTNISDLREAHKQ